MTNEGVAHHSISHKKRPLLFLIVGIGNTLFDFIFYTLLTTYVFKGEDRIALAGAVSGTFALLCAFLTHSLITWRGSDISHKTIIKFVLFTGFGMWIIRPVLLAIFIHLNSLYDFAYTVSSSIGLPFSKAFITTTGAFGFMAVIVLLYNYYVYGHYVFKTRTASRTAPETR